MYVKGENNQKQQTKETKEKGKMMIMENNFFVFEFDEDNGIKTFNLSLVQSIETISTIDGKENNLETPSFCSGINYDVMFYFINGTKRREILNENKYNELLIELGLIKKEKW